MVTQAPSSWTVRGATFALWLLVAASAAYWGLRLTSGPAPLAAAATGTRAPAPADPVVVARLLGASSGPTAAAPAPTLASRFVLVGVAAGARSGGGAALIAIDGKPAKPYRVGSAVDEGLVLQSVQARRAVLAATPEGPQVLALELPLPKK